MLITSTLQLDQPLLTVNSAGDSFVAVSWTLTPGWETALEAITSKVLSTNLNYITWWILTREGNSWIANYCPSESYYIQGNDCSNRAISQAAAKAPVKVITARAHTDQMAAQVQKSHIVH